MARATSSLPVPVSPWISTETVDCASRSTVRPICCIVGLAATSPGTSGGGSGASGGAMVASSSASTVRPIRMRVPIGTTASLIRTSPTKVPLRLPRSLTRTPSSQRSSR